MPLEGETYMMQRALADFCRGKVWTKIPGVREERAVVYKGLVSNGIESALQNAYPITHASLTALEWSTLVIDFISGHAAESPFLWRMPRELFEFVVRTSYANRLKRPYLKDLLLLEWIEIEVYMMEDLSSPTVKLQGDVMCEKLVLNPEHRIVKLDYPVFKSPLSEVEDNKGEYFLVCFRDPETSKVRFMELSKICTSIIESLKRENLSARELLASQVFTHDTADDDNLNSNVGAFLKGALEERLIIGFLAEN